MLVFLPLNKTGCLLRWSSCIRGLLASTNAICTTYDHWCRSVRTSTTHIKPPSMARGIVRRPHFSIVQSHPTIPTKHMDGFWASTLATRLVATSGATPHPLLDSEQLAMKRFLIVGF